MPTCNNPTCGATYKRTRTWQKYCSGACRAAARNQGIRDRTASPLAHAVIDAAMAWHTADAHRQATERLWAACYQYGEELADQEEP